MNWAHIHLLLNHVPVLGALFGLGLLLAGIGFKNTALQKAGLVVFVLVALVALPVFFTGEPAENVVENLPGVREPSIERHQDLAKISLAVAEILGLCSLAALMSSRLSRRLAAVILPAVLLLSVVTGGLMAWTANLGGQIRHSEISRAAASSQQGTLESNAQESHRDDE